MNAGVAIAEFFSEHAKASFDGKRHEAMKYANKILKKIQRKRIGPFFTRRDAQRAVGHCKVAQTISGLDLLEKNKYIDTHTDFKNKTTYIVNPNFLNETHNNAQNSSHMPHPVPQLYWANPASIYG